MAAGLGLSLALAAAACAVPNIATQAYRPDDPTARAVIDQARQAGIRSAVVDRKQSIRLMRGKVPLARLVTGRGQAARSDGIETATCFAVFIPTGGKPQLLATMGHGEWEATTCSRVVAIGLVRSTHAPLRIALIHDGASPNYGEREPIILSFDPCLRSARLDLDAYHRASRAGAQSVSQVRAALR